MPEQMTTAGFQEAIRSGRVVPGDAVCYQYGSPSLLARAIRRVQRRALTDLLAGSDDPEAIAEVAETYCGYTHAGMVLDECCTVEMTSPLARVAYWETVLTPGDRVLIVRPRAVGSDGAEDERRLHAALSRAARQALCLATHGQRYPWRELLTYWFSTLPGAIAAPHFAEHFRDGRRNVCSGTVWAAWHACGAVCPEDQGDLLPESWYPARLAADREYLAAVAEFEVGGNAARCAAQQAGKEWTMKTRMAGAMGIVGLACLVGCVAYRAPVLVYQRGPETNYNQERSGVQSRSTTAEQQVAETTAQQDQQTNTTDSNMPTAVDTTRQVGTVKSGQSATGTQTQGREDVTGGAATGGAATGQEGGDAAAVGQVPTAGGGGGGQGGTGASPTGGTNTTTKTCPTCGKAVTADADGDGTCDGCEEPAAGTTTK